MHSDRNSNLKNRQQDSISFQIWICNRNYYQSSCS